jgi:hypothetical protein
VADRIAVALITGRDDGEADDVGAEPGPRPGMRGPETAATARTVKHAKGKASLSATRAAGRPPGALTDAMVASAGAGLQVPSISAAWARIRSRRSNSKFSALIGRVPPVAF